MNEEKLKALAGILYQSSLVQIEFQDKSYMKGIEELRYVYHGIAIELLNMLREQECDDWRELIESRLFRALGNEENTKQFMMKVKSVIST